MGKIHREEPFERHTKGISEYKRGCGRYRKGIVVGRPKFKKIRIGWFADTDSF